MIGTTPDKCGTCILESVSEINDLFETIFAITYTIEKLIGSKIVCGNCLITWTETNSATIIKQRQIRNKYYICSACHTAKEILEIWKQLDATKERKTA